MDILEKYITIKKRELKRLGHFKRKECLENIKRDSKRSSELRVNFEER